MFSIGELSRRTKVKVPTIRYYEEAGLLERPERNEGNQRRYDAKGLERLSFIRHARDLGFPIEAIASLIELQEHPDRSCDAAARITEARLRDVRAKLSKLRALERELRRISTACGADCVSEGCHILASLADHDQCHRDH